MIYKSNLLDSLSLNYIKSATKEELFKDLDSLENDLKASNREVREEARRDIKRIKKELFNRTKKEFE